MPTNNTVTARREYVFSNDETGAGMSRAVEIINAIGHVAERVAMVAALLARQGAQVEIVGVWVWATFPARPPENVLAALHQLRCHWNRRRSLWQYAGRRAGRSSENSGTLRLRYGAHPVVIGGENTVDLSNTRRDGEEI